MEEICSLACFSGLPSLLSHTTQGHHPRDSIAHNDFPSQCLSVLPTGQSYQSKFHLSSWVSFLSSWQEANHHSQLLTGLTSCDACQFKISSLIMLWIILILPIVLFFFLLACVIYMRARMLASVRTQGCTCELGVMTQPQSLFHISYWGEVSQAIQSWTMWIVSLAGFRPELELQVCQFVHSALIQTLEVWTLAQSSHSCSKYFRNRGISLPLLQNIMYFICLGVYLNVCTHAHVMEYIGHLVEVGSLLPCDQYWEQVYWSAEPSFRPNLAFLR